MNKNKKRSVAEGVRRWLKAETPAKASSRFLHLKELTELGGIDFPMLPCCRVSTQRQYDEGALERQRARLRKAIKEAGFKIARYNNGEEVWIMEVSEGKVNRVGLEFIKQMAEELGAIVVIESVDRLIRAKDFHPTMNPSAQLRDEDIEEFIPKMRGIPIATVIHPDADYTEIKSYQKKFGMTEDNKGGKPKKNKPGYKKRRRDKKKPRVLQLHKKGATWGDIFALTGTPKSTARDWVKEGNK